MNHQKIDFIHNLTDLEVRFIPKENKDEFSSLYSLERDFPESGTVELVKDSTGVRFISSVYETGILLTGPFILEGDPIPRIGGNNLAGIELPAKSESKVHSYLTVLKLLTEQIELPGVDAESGIEIHNPVRVYKNMAIVTNSIGRLSAEKGGLPPFLLHSLSENISIQIEKLSSLKEVVQYTSRIPLQYCDAVHSYGIENHSAVIVKACHYILKNLHEKIGLDDLAEHTGTNRSYLSRRFHRETGKTISAYMREKRILEAKWMLRHSGESVTNVALSLGFEDINYFSRIFRKEAGVSPSQYKNRYSSEDFDGLPE